jgi:hypothetical protein
MSIWLATLRVLLRVPAPLITRQQAIAIAVAEATKRGAPPLSSGHYASPGPSAREQLRDWAVLLEPDFRPSRIVVIDNQSGQVKAYTAPLR